jgi:hypothetical protein
MALRPRPQVRHLALDAPFQVDELAVTFLESVVSWAVSCSRHGVHALWVSAKGAVDNDLVQGALEEGELLIVELGDEQL